MTKVSISKLGVTIVLMVDTLLILVAAAITVGFVSLFTNAETETLEEATQVATNVLQYSINSKADETSVLAQLLADDSSFTQAIIDGDSATNPAEYSVFSPIRTELSDIRAITALYLLPDCLTR